MRWLEIYERVAEFVDALSRAVLCVFHLGFALFFFELERASFLILLEESAQAIARIEKADPLLVIQCDGKAAEPVNADAAFFANSKFKLAGAAAGGLLFQFGNARLQVFISGFRHFASSKSYTT